MLDNTTTHSLVCVVENLGLEIKKRAKGSDRGYFIGIGGYTSLGKTTMSKQLGKSLSAAVMQTDSFMRDRKTRQELKLKSGNSLAAFELDKFISHMKSLTDGNEIEVPIYNHATGTHDKNIIIKPNKYVILEGVHLVHPEVEDFLDLTIFLNSDESTTKALVSRAEIEERGYSPEKHEENWKNYLLELPQYIPSPRKDRIICVVNEARKFSSEVVVTCICK